MAFSYSKDNQLKRARKSRKTDNGRRRRGVKRRGNKTAAWETERKKLKVIYEAKGITRCEWPGCGTDFGLGFAHRHKRVDTTDEELGSYDHTLLLCTRHHQVIEPDRWLTRIVFNALRPEKS